MLTLIDVFAKDPEIDPEIVEQLRKLRLSQKWNRKVSEDLAKERAKRWSQSQGNSTDAAIS